MFLSLLLRTFMRAKNSFTTNGISLLDSRVLLFWRKCKTKLWRKVRRFCKREKKVISRIKLRAVDVCVCVCVCACVCVLCSIDNDEEAEWRREKGRYLCRVTHAKTNSKREQRERKRKEKSKILREREKKKRETVCLIVCVCVCVCSKIARFSRLNLERWRINEEGDKKGISSVLPKVLWSIETEKV